MLLGPAPHILSILGRQRDIELGGHVLRLRQVDHMKQLDGGTECTAKLARAQDRGPGYGAEVDGNQNPLDGVGHACLASFFKGSSYRLRLPKAPTGFRRLVSSRHRKSGANS